jgi:pyruvate-ferredoxin/flavodoxin oxidoreductase
MTSPTLARDNESSPEPDQAAAAATAAPASAPQSASESWATVDGNEAAARVAHALSEVIAIYPITPASPMGEYADAWSAVGRPNLWGTVPEVIEMQSEAGAAGLLHGALQSGTLSTTFTASQGLLLMIPNMYKIAGELTPAVIHVAARTIATHALSIFGDHSDVMSVRSAGWAMLCASSVQEAHDFALISHAATLRACVPFIHFFDGFRTSHEINKIITLADDDLRALVREEDVLAHRSRALSPEHPVLRGSAQNPDVFFQAREGSGPAYAAVPGIVSDLFDQLAQRTGRRYNLVEYIGHPEAERVVVLMGSGAGAVTETIEELVRRGEKVGAVIVRLYRPFPSAALIEALPQTVTTIATLDRTKEPGSIGEPLYLDVVAGLAEHGRTGVQVVGGRYGLSGKEFTPAMVKGLFDELAGPAKRRQFTLGIHDDVNDSSVPPDPDFQVPTTAVQAVFFGLGSDGTVGASKSSIKIIGDHKGGYAQGYFTYDSKKAGSVTVSHLRFGPDPIRSTYLIHSADFVSVNQFHLLERMKVVELARSGATVLFNSPYPAREVWQHLPAEVQRQILAKDLRCYAVDAHRIARKVGLGSRINTVMQSCFFVLSGILPKDEAISAIKKSITKSYGKRGAAVVEHNHTAVDMALAELAEVPVGEVGTVARVASVPAEAPDFVQQIIGRIIAGEGDSLPVSALPADGTFPTDTTQWERRSLALEIPIWDPSSCTDCGKCTIVCPHAAIRMKAFPPEALEGAPEGFESKKYGARRLAGNELTVQVSPDDCTGCTLCVDACPNQSLVMEPIQRTADAERIKWEFFRDIPEIDRALVRHESVPGCQLLQPLFEFSGACSGCGETPYLKLLSQLFGDRLVIANATGCSSIYGGNLPTTPWAQDSAGRGPAWSNSLFEDNAEFGLGLRVGYERLADQARVLLADVAASGGPGAGLAPMPGVPTAEEFVALTQELLDADQSSEAGIIAQRGRVDQLKSALRAVHGVPGADNRLGRLRSLAHHLVRRSYWIVGGDGWAYDIGFGGLDHVLSTGRNVNILVMDTEVYSNTGGQASKSTGLGAVAKFAAGGKTTAKKDLGAMARAYGNVYVAQVAIGAKDAQTVKALLEAEAWPGPSLVIAYSTCIEHGIDMTESLAHQRLAVSSGYWTLYRHNPGRAAGAFQLDSTAPAVPLADFTSSETRFATLAKAKPEVAAELQARAQADAEQRWQQFEKLAEKKK